jgi:hypothetical protein
VTPTGSSTCSRPRWATTGCRSGSIRTDRRSSSPRRPRFVVVAQCAPGRIAEATAWGNDVLSHASKTTGLDGSFLRLLYGPWATLAWIMLVESMEEVDIATGSLAADGTYLERIDDAGPLFLRAEGGRCREPCEGGERHCDRARREPRVVPLRLRGRRRVRRGRSPRRRGGRSRGVHGRASAATKLKTVKLLTLDEADAAIGRSVAYRPPGT